MRYVYEWGAGQSVYLENVDSQTCVTLSNSRLGQQQQATSRFQTGLWTAPPEVLQAPNGLVIKLFTAPGEQFVSIQGNSVTASSEAPAWDDAQPMQAQSISTMPASTMPPLPPLSPLPPMSMGEMQINQTGMTMQMGRMRLEMNLIAQAIDPHPITDEPSESTVSQRNFCSQCGSAIKPSDRFCAHCGHRLA